MAGEHKDDTNELIEHILRLRRLEQRVDPEARAALSEVRRFLEDAGGPTVSRAKAARALGISQTALDRWIGKGEIAVVITPRGRREVPLTEVIELLLEVEQADGHPSRPLAPVIRERKRRASEEIDLDRLVPRKRSRSHQTADLQSLAYHRLVAERLDEHSVQRARQRLRKWIESGRIHPSWGEEWKRLLELPTDRIAKAIGADTIRARELRQTSPFAGQLTEQERHRLRLAVEARSA